MKKGRRNFIKNFTGTTSTYTIGGILPDRGGNYNKGWKPVV